MADIGLVGLGVMGANLALNMAEKGYTVAVYNRTAEKIDAFIADAGSLAERLTPCQTLAPRRGGQAAAADHHHGQGRRSRSTRRPSARRSSPRATS